MNMDKVETKIIDRKLRALKELMFKYNSLVSSERVFMCDDYTLLYRAIDERINIIEQKITRLNRPIIEVN